MLYGDDIILVDGTRKRISIKVERWTKTLDLGI